MENKILSFFGGLILGFIFILMYIGSSFWYNLAHTISPKTVDNIEYITLIVFGFSLILSSIFFKKIRFWSIGLLVGIGLFFLILDIGWETPMF